VEGPWFSRSRRRVEAPHHACTERAIVLTRAHASRAGDSFLGPYIRNLLRLAQIQISISYRERTRVLHHKDASAFCSISMVWTKADHNCVDPQMPRLCTCETAIPSVQSGNHQSSMLALVLSAVTQIARESSVFRLGRACVLCGNSFSWRERRNLRHILTLRGLRAIAQK
jgi:hypothetical protein